MDTSPELARSDYVVAKDAMKLLDVRAQTLYAYVSRGWIRSVGQPGRKERLYLRADVERMGKRAQARAGHGPVAAAAMNHGEPIIPTSITEISAEGPRYRGRLATELARVHAPFEAVAELLWSGSWNDGSPRWDVERPSKELRELIGSMRSPLAADQLVEIFALVTLRLGLGNGTVAERVRRGRTLEAARQIISTLVGCCGLATKAGDFVPMRRGQSVSEALMHALGATPSPQNQLAIETMLILLADHELSPDTLSARVAASSGATLHSCVASALCTSSGVHMARVFDRVDTFLHGASSKAALLKRAAQLQQQGTAVPGFVHPLYPRGDPRAQLLFELVRARPPTRQLAAVCGFVEEFEKLTGLHARHELAMVALTRDMGLAPQTPSALFVLARVAGWVAHVQEQRLLGQMLRPRAKFVGSSAEAAIATERPIAMKCESGNQP
jgi:citrate synthase